MPSLVAIGFVTTRLALQVSTADASASRMTGEERRLDVGERSREDAGVTSSRGEDQRAFDADDSALRACASHALAQPRGARDLEERANECVECSRELLLETRTIDVRREPFEKAGSLATPVERIDGVEQARELRFRRWRIERSAECITENTLEMAEDRRRHFRFTAGEVVIEAGLTEARSLG